MGSPATSTAGAAAVAAAAGAGSGADGCGADDAENDSRPHPPSRSGCRPGTGGPSLEQTRESQVIAEYC